MDMTLEKAFTVRRPSAQNRTNKISNICRYYMANDTVDEKIVQKHLRKKINIASEVLGEELRSWI